jgi:hypothetical protein
MCGRYQLAIDEEELALLFCIQRRGWGQTA